jgi:CRISPR/Cas system CSM-associated protein Csm2 small subunit
LWDNDIDAPRCGEWTLAAENAVNVKILEEVGRQCLSLDQGERLYRILQPALKNKETVQLDFSGVENMLTPFLHAAIGKLLDLYGTEAVLAQVSPVNITREHLQRFNNYVDRRGRENDKADARGFLEEAFGEDELGDTGL